MQLEQVRAGRVSFMVFSNVVGYKVIKTSNFGLGNYEWAVAVIEMRLADASSKRKPIQLVVLIWILFELRTSVYV